MDRPKPQINEVNHTNIQVKIEIVCGAFEGIVGIDEFYYSFSLIFHGGIDKIDLKLKTKLTQSIEYLKFMRNLKPSSIDSNNNSI